MVFALKHSDPSVQSYATNHLLVEKLVSERISVFTEEKADELQGEWLRV
jgi:hypothetical protein